MKLRIMSDLHVEFHNNVEDFVVSELPTDSDTTLILAGDIHSGKRVHEVLEPLAKRFKHIVFVLGNHEFYGSNLPTVPDKVAKSLHNMPNVHYLESDSVELDGIHFVGATLWTDMDNGNEMTMVQSQEAMSDYRVIRSGPTNEPWKWRLKPIETVGLHKKQRDFMFERIAELKAAGETVVAVSHHLPSFQCVAPQYKGSNLNGAYASELFEQIADTKPDLWIHGHTHDSIDLIMEGTETRIICNPRGYWPTDLNPDFDMDFTVEIG